MSGESEKAIAKSLASAGQPDTSQLVRKVDAALVELHGRRLVQLGGDASGLFNHYVALMNQGAIVCTEQIQSYRLVREVLPAYGEYAVLRAGLGELGFLLNGAGFRVVACDPNEARFEAMKAGLDHLAASHVVNRDYFRMVPDLLPDRVDVRPLLGIATVFIFDQPLEADEAFRSGLRQFDGLLINPRLFIRLRDSPSDQREVRAFLHTLGFSKAMEFPGEQMVYFERLSADRDETQYEMPTVRAAAASPGLVDSAAFAPLVQRMMSLVPHVRSPNGRSTWVERRVRNFDLRSAYGNEE